MLLHIDFETYSSCDIAKAGHWRYAWDDSTLLLCAAFAYDSSPVQTLDFTADIEGISKMDGILSRATEIHAFNAGFERALISRFFPQHSTRLEYLCSSALSATFGLPRTLAAVGAALGLAEDAKKDKEGRKLIEALCKPQNDGTRQTSPYLQSRLVEYCAQDVVAARNVLCVLQPHITPRFREEYKLCQRINARGVKIDLNFARLAVDILAGIETAEASELQKLTGGINLSSPAQMRDFFARHGVVLENAQAAYLDSLQVEDPLLRRVLEIRSSAATSSTAKFSRMLDCADEDGVVRGLYRYHGASTGRWSGELIQPQNLPRPELEGVETLVSSLSDTVRAYGMAPASGAFLALYPLAPRVALKSCLRAAIMPRDGHVFVIADFSQIEARVLAWLAGQKNVIETYKNGGDIYVETASKIYHIPASTVSKHQRQIGKIAVLALGYGGGRDVFIAMAKAYGLDITLHDATGIVQSWREANPNIVNFWATCESQAKAALCQKATRSGYYRSRRHQGNLSLVCALPSGREMVYHAARMKADGTISYMSTKLGGYVETMTYGGKLAENLVQATARDLLVDAMLRVDPLYPIVMHAHDELVCETPENLAAKAKNEIEKIMTTAPAWAKELPLGCAVSVARRYGK